MRGVGGGTLESREQGLGAAGPPGEAEVRALWARRGGRHEVIPHLPNAAFLAYSQASGASGCSRAAAERGGEWEPRPQMPWPYMPRGSGAGARRCQGAEAAGATSARTNPCAGCLRALPPRCGGSAAPTPHLGTAPGCPAPPPEPPPAPRKVPGRAAASVHIAAISIAGLVAKFSLPCFA